jgi:hypothetical protein
VYLYVSGNDHNQQLILKEGEPAWVIFGGGGQKLSPLNTKLLPVSFAKSQAGFAKLDFTPTQLKLAYYSLSTSAAAHYEWSPVCPWMVRGCLVESTSRLDPTCLLKIAELPQLLSPL